MRSKRRRRLALLVILTGAVSAIVAYRSRTLSRHSAEFRERYGD
jgi:hypothetical protein